MEEPDYMLRLEGFTEANGLIKQMVTMETDVCLAVIYNCCYFITAVSTRLQFTFILQIISVPIGAGLRSSAGIMSDCISRGLEFDPGTVPYFYGD